MRIHVVCTKNGLLNEGMNTIEAHFTKRMSEKHEVSNSSLKDIIGQIKGEKEADCVLIYSRANRKTYWLARLAGLLCKNVWFVIVQTAETDFIRLVRKHPLSCNYLFLSENDMEGVNLSSGKKKVHFYVGIHSDKFVPVSRKKAAELKNKYGFSPDKYLVVHVGHASIGRGIEDMAKIDRAVFDTLFVDSGIFDNPSQQKQLEESGVRIIRGYLENIEEIYQMADAYLLPTQSGDYVISVPLSVMEALACGTAAVAYKEIHSKDSIKEAVEGSIIEIADSSQLNGALKKAADMKSEIALLKGNKSWADAADYVENVIMETSAS